MAEPTQQADIDAARGLMSEAALTISQILALQSIVQTEENFEHLLVVSSYALRDLGRRMDKAQEALGGVRGGWFDDEAGDE